jgi:hypothetical protein
VGRLKSASQTSNNLTFTYDALGRKLTDAGPLGTATSTWNLDGTRATLRCRAAASRRPTTATRPDSC